MAVYGPQCYLRFRSVQCPPNLRAIDFQWPINNFSIYLPIEILNILWWKCGSRRQKPEECPQARKTGVNAVQGSCPQSSSRKFVIVTMCKMTEIQTTDGGQKDFLLRRTNIKKIVVNDIIKTLLWSLIAPKGFGFFPHWCLQATRVVGTKWHSLKPMKVTKKIFNHVEPLYCSIVKY